MDIVPLSSTSFLVSSEVYRDGASVILKQTTHSVDETTHNIELVKTEYVVEKYIAEIVYFQKTMPYNTFDDALADLQDEQ